MPWKLPADAEGASVVHSANPKIEREHLAESAVNRDACGRLGKSTVEAACRPRQVASYSCNFAAGTRYAESV